MIDVQMRLWYGIDAEEGSAWFYAVWRGAEAMHHADKYDLFTSFAFGTCAGLDDALHYASKAVRAAYDLEMKEEVLPNI